VMERRWEVVVVLAQVEMASLGQRPACLGDRKRGWLSVRGSMLRLAYGQMMACSALVWLSGTMAAPRHLVGLGMLLVMSATEGVGELVELGNAMEYELLHFLVDPR
jgi:hypothetical protein